MRTIALAIALAAATTGTGAFAAQTMPSGTAGQSIFARGGEVFAKFEGFSASFSSDLYLQNTGMYVFNNKTTPVGTTQSLGTFDPGTELVFRLFTNDTGKEFFSGPASANADGNVHARVQEYLPQSTLVGFEDLVDGDDDFNDLTFSLTNTSVNAVPEPATWAMMLFGFFALGAVVRQSKQRQNTALSYS